MVNKLLSAAALTAALFSGPTASAQQAIPLAVGGSACGNAPGAGQWIDYTINLQAGRDYFFGGAREENPVRADVLSPAGRVLRTFYPPQDGFAGTEFRASTTASYRLRLTELEEWGSFDGFCVSAGSDCRGGVTTRCTLALGQSRVGNWDFNTINTGNAEAGKSEWDYYKVRLRSGRTYNAILSVEYPSPIRISILNSSNREIVGSGQVYTGPEILNAQVTFRVGSTGYYYIRTAGSYDRQKYTVLVR